MIFVAVLSRTLVAADAADSKADATIPGTLRIIRATYQSVNGTPARDVTGLLTSEIVGNTLSLTADNATLGGDPAEGIKKQLVVECELAGKVQHQTVAENETLAINVGNATAQPFVREVATGDLLRFNFNAREPYCWQGAPLLSGWETDMSGGSWDYAVKKAFDLEWFKLVDTSDKAAVSIRHQVARQTAGTVTLEFRFRMPVKMDGVRWELRDLERAGVRLVTTNGTLCWEPGKALLPLEADREYGVKVVADITARKADVFVDGELKGQRLPFCQPVGSIDFVRVQTGEAATGELFLSPVNLYKGYAVHETFVTTGVGKAPADWQAKSASVQEFACGPKPDIFSLKLTGGTATKGFTPLTGKTIFECRFLLPGKADGLRVELAGAVALDAAASYRTNLWYMAKVIADPATQTADIFLNGKLARKGVAFRKRVRAFDEISFAGSAWIDDVLVYPWRDYPVDYVPAPKPVAARTSGLVGVQSCNLFREGTAYAGWDYVYPYRSTHKPVLGWYDEGDAEETDWEIKWQVEHGINFEMHCWYRPSFYAVGQPIKDGDMDQGIIRGLFNARYSHLKRFAIMYTNDNGGFTTPDDLRRNLVPYWIEYFFKDPRYLQLDGKPVICLYDYKKLAEDLGGAGGVKSAVQFLRDEAAKAGFPGLIVMTEFRNDPTEVEMQQRKTAGFDAVYAYCWVFPHVGTQQQKNIAQRDAANRAGLDMLPEFGMGWDSRPWGGVNQPGWASAADYKQLAQWVRDEFQPTLPANSLGRRMLILDNWCEFGEGHFIMPATGTGFGYLDAIREVFTTGGPHEDTVPTDQQKRRFTVLFPRD
jgi:hypothetical protein